LSSGKGISHENSQANIADMGKTITNDPNVDHDMDENNNDDDNDVEIPKSPV
jgi:hypothetical protein